MRAGKFDSVITILRRGENRDVLGGVDNSLALVEIAKVPAMFREKSITEGLDNGRARTTISSNFIIRGSLSVRANDVIDYNGVEYAVQGARIFGNPRERLIEIVCSRGDDLA